MFNKIISGLLLAGTWAGAAQDIPPPPKADAVFPEWRMLADTATAQKLFAPMDETPQVEWAAPGFARLPVNFADARHARVSWDLRIKTDLRLAKGVQFDFYCRDLAPFSSFSLYFRSGGGWYHASFSPESTGAWQRIVVDKADARVEGQSAGWGTVDTLRISGWRGRDSNTVCAIANLGFAGGKPEALVVRADSNVAKAGGEGKAFGEYASTVSATLDALGVASAQVADTDLAADLLKEVKLVVLPYNPRVSPEAVALLRPFVARGGKLLVCYSLSGGVDGLLGLKTADGVVAEGGTFSGFARTAQGLATQPAFAPQASWRTAVVKAAEGQEARVLAVWRDSTGKDTATPAVTLTPTGAFLGHVWFNASCEESLALMRAVVGELVPGVWRQTAAKAFERIGVMGGQDSFKALRDALLETAAGPSRQALAEAVKARNEALRLMKAERWVESVEASKQAAAAAARAWFLTQTPCKGEHRAFWCHSAFGLRDKGWDDSIRFLKENGFNAILPNMLWAGTAYYPSTLLPENADLATKGDQIAQCLAACKKYGVQCHVWKVNWNTGGRAPKAFIGRMVAEGRVQKMFSGELKEEWLCPSNPTNQALEVDSMLEIVRNYAVDGVHFDYIRYPGDETCFCDGCRSRFEAVLGHTVGKWPQDTRKVAAVRQKWLDFRRSNIDAVVRQVSEEARKIRPGVQISAAVFRNWPTDRDGVGQDWKLWCEKGWLDFVCPMDYIDSNTLFRNVVTSQKAFAGKARLYPGIGLSCWKDPRDAAKLAQQITLLRELEVPGFTVFNYDVNAETVLPSLRLGITSE